MASQYKTGLLTPWLRRKRFEVALPLLKGRVLDFGCGSGLLAEFVPSDRYLGVEIDLESLQAARSRFPNHRFVVELPPSEQKFDSIIALAVIEHVKDPIKFLRYLADKLDADLARLIVTTPHPSMESIYDLGARIGLFSQHASHDHEDLLGRKQLEDSGIAAGLKIVSYERFLLGANLGLTKLSFSKNPTNEDQLEKGISVQ